MTGTDDGSRMNSMNAIAVSATLLYATIGFALGARVETTPAAPSIRLALELSSTQNTYRVGEAVLLRIQVRNASSGAVSVADISPWFAVKIDVSRDGATLVQPSSDHLPYSPKSPSATRLPPGHLYTYHFGDSQSNPLGAYPLSDWGYGPLPAGRYTIAAIPVQVAAIEQHRWFTLDEHQQSNAVQVEIIP